MCAGDVADGIDHDHDHEAEADRDADMAQRVGRGVDHDGATAGEHKGECANRLGQKRSGQASVHQQQPDRAAGRSAARSFVPWVALTALMMAPCIPSATWWVKTTETSSSPAASSP